MGVCAASADVVGFKYPLIKIIVKDDHLERANRPAQTVSFRPHSMLLVPIGRYLGEIEEPAASARCL